MNDKAGNPSYSIESAMFTQVEAMKLLTKVLDLNLDSDWTLIKK